MDFSVEFYQTAAGGCPVRDDLDDLAQRNPGDFASLMAGMARLRNRQYHRPPLSKPIGDGLFELRHVGKLNSRVLYFFMQGNRIILLHVIRNKARAIPDRDRRVALDRMKDWLSRAS